MQQKRKSNGEKKERVGKGITSAALAAIKTQRKNIQTPERIKRKNCKDKSHKRKMVNKF